MLTILILYLGMAAKLVFLQGVEAQKFNSIASKQRLRMVEIPGDRGLILDRNRTPIATNSSRKTVIANPKLIKNKTKTALIISEYLKMPVKEVKKELRKDCGFVYIARKIDSFTAKKLAKRNLKGLFFVDESKRVYPCGSLASNLIGFAGTDNEGLAGLEQKYETFLRGRSGIIMVERDPMGREIPEGIKVVKSQKMDGRNLVLTIDGPIQSLAESVLAKTVKDFSAKGGSIIVINPNDGEIYAMANSPSFNPNQLKKVKISQIRNSAISDIYEPGSTFKTFTATAVIEEGLAGPQDFFSLPTTLRVGDRVIHEAHRKVAVSYSLTDILSKSSNIGAVKLGMLLGKKKLCKYIYRFGFGSKTQIDFPGEAKGMVRPPGLWYISTIGNVPMGQGISVTTIQMIRAYSAIANGGKLVTPHFVRRIEDSEGKALRVFNAERSVRILSQRSCKIVRDILKKTITQGTGKLAKLEDYVSCGKTGTAQKPNEDSAGYSSGKYVGSFIGMAPADNPKIVVMVMLDEPHPIWGGVVAAPAFKEVAGFALRRLDVKPSPQPDENAGGEKGKIEVKDQ